MKRHCIWGGILVGMREWLPTLSNRYSWDSRIGCNNVRCCECGHSVRHAARLSIRDRNIDYELLAETEDWSTLPFVRPASGRLYACRCSLVSISGPKPSQPSEHSFEHEFGVERSGWHCRGHDAPSIPVNIDGVTVQDGWDIDALAEQVLMGENPARIDETAQRSMSFDRAMWLVDLYHVLPEPWDGQVDKAVSRLLESDDLAVRAGALSFYRHMPYVPATRAEELFRGFDDPLGQYHDLGKLWDHINVRLRLPPGSSTKQ